MTGPRPSCQPFSAMRYEALSKIMMGSWLITLTILTRQTLSSASVGGVASLCAVHILGAQIFAIPATVMFLGWRRNQPVKTRNTTPGPSAYLFWQTGKHATMLLFLLAPAAVVLAMSHLGLSRQTLLVFLFALLSVVLLVPAAWNLVRAYRTHLQPIDPDPVVKSCQNFAVQKGCPRAWIELAEPELLPYGVPAACFAEGLIRIRRDLPDLLSEDQLQAVFAHELAHYAANDSLLSYLAELAAIFATVSVGLAFGVLASSGEMSPWNAALQVGPTAMLLVWLTDATAQIARKNLSRFQERRAHRRAAAWIANAQTYLEAMSLVHPNPNSVENPSRLVHCIFATHPSLAEVKDLVRQDQRKQSIHQEEQA